MKKNYFIIVSVIQIILSLVVIGFSGKIVGNTVKTINESVEVFEEFGNGFKSAIEQENTTMELKDEEEDSFSSLFKAEDEERLNALFNLSDENFFEGYFQRIIIASSIVIIIISIITIIIAKNNHILRNKKRIIFYCIITMLFGTNIIINVLGFVSFIVILCLKRKDEEDYPVPKGKITPLEKMYRSKKEIILGVLAIVAYVVLYIALRTVLDHFFPALSANKTTSCLIDIVIDMIVLIIVLAIYKEELLNGIKAVKSEFTYYRRFIRRRFIITLLITMLANIVRLIFTKSTTSENQFALFELPIWYLFPIAVIWAPIVEESIFRGSLKRIIPNKYVFIIFSGLLFGVVHAISEASIFDIVITSIPYCVMGLSFAMAYEKSNNIITNIAMHSLNNFLSMVLLITVFGV